MNQVQAVNYVPYGGVYYARETYRDFDVTGGMWLQKATHDFDCLNALLGTPTAVSAVMTAWPTAETCPTTCAAPPATLPTRASKALRAWPGAATTAEWARVTTSACSATA